MRTLFCFAVAALSVGVMGQSQRDWGANSRYNQAYDSKNIVTFSGRVTGIIDTSDSKDIASPSETILVKTPKGGISSVDLGPSWFINHQAERIHMNDEVTVTGSKVKVDGRYYVLAAKLSRERSVVWMRQKDGSPLWVATRTRKNLDRTPPDKTIEAAPSGQDLTPVEGESQVEGTIKRYVTEMVDGVPYSYMDVDTPNGPVRIQLGPQWYTDRQDMTAFPIGDNIVAYGRYANEVQAGYTGNIIIANDVARGDAVLQLRYSNGSPVWQIWR